MCTLPAAALPSNYKEHKTADINGMLHKIRHVNIMRGIRVQPDSFLLELAKENASEIPILVTPYCNGGNLRHQLNDQRNLCGMCENDVRTILMALKNAIFYLHSLSIVHRDLKPESVVIEVTADGQRVYKLTDSGNSKPHDMQTIETGKHMAYTAPEQIINTAEKYGPAVDYWSLGVIASEIATGVRPFVPHLPLAQWVLRVREKKSQHISIYESNDGGELIYSNRIWPSNQLTSAFIDGFEHWLQLALEWNPKQRGCVFQKTLMNSNDGKDPPAQSGRSPVQVLKFFDTMDDLLSQKLLTIFTLSNHQLMSIPVSEHTTMADVHAFIAQKVQIPPENCQIINGQSKSLTADHKPIDLCRDDCSIDEPMIFVAQLKSLSPTTTDNGTTDSNVIFPTDIPITVQNVLKSPEKPLKPYALRRFACDAVHFVRMENRKFKLGLHGWCAFAEQLNHDIEQCQPDVRRMQSAIYGLAGALDLFKMTQQMASDKQSSPTPANEFSSITKMAQNLECLESACDKIALRHNSLHRRCREICHHELFAKRMAQEFYDLANLNRAYATLQDQMARNKLPSRPHFELFQCVFKCLKQRDTLLRNTAFCELKRNLMCIHTELIEMRKALEKAIAPAERYRSELWEANKKLHENAWCATATATEAVPAPVEAPTGDEHVLTIATRDIATSTTNLIHLTTNGTNPNDDSAALNGMDQDQRVELIDHLKSLASDSDQQSHVMQQTKSIIEDNINLRISMADVMNEIDDELRRTSI